MQFKLAAFTTLFAAATLAAATATPAKRFGGEGPQNQCNTGELLCCNSVQAASSPAAITLIGLLGAVVKDITASVGITCTPVTVIGAGGNSCAIQPICCTDNSFNGVIALGCNSINGNA